MADQVLNRPYSKAYEWKIVIIFFFCWGFIFLDRMVVAFITPTLAEVFELNFEAIGNILTVTNLCYAIATILFGVFAIKIKQPKKWLIIFCLSTGIVSACCMFVQTYNQLLVLRGIIGALEGPISPLMLVLVSRAASEKTFGLDVGIINMGVALIALTFGPKFAIWSVGQFGWQMAFMVVSLPSIIVALVVIFTTHEVFIDKEAAAAGQDVSQARFWDVLKYKNVIITGIIAILAGGSYWVIIGFAPMYMTTICGYTQQSLGNVIFWVGILTIIYAVVIPKLSDIFGRKPILALFLVIVAIGTFIMAFFPVSRTWSLPVFTYIIIGGMIGCFGPIAWNIIPMESVPLHLKATSCGLVLGTCEIVGGAVLPKVGGMVADAYGLTTTFTLISVLLVIGFVFAFFLTETLPAKVKAKAAAATASQPA